MYEEIGENSKGGVARIPVGRVQTPGSLQPIGDRLHRPGNVIVGDIQGQRRQPGCRDQLFHQLLFPLEYAQICVLLRISRDL